MEIPRAILTRRQLRIWLRSKLALRSARSTHNWCRFLEITDMFLTQSPRNINKKLVNLFRFGYSWKFYDRQLSLYLPSANNLGDTFKIYGSLFCNYHTLRFKDRMSKVCSSLFMHINYSCFFPWNQFVCSISSWLIARLCGNAPTPSVAMVSMSPVEFDFDLILICLHVVSRRIVTFDFDLPSRLVSSRTSHRVFKILYGTSDFFQICNVPNLEKMKLKKGP